MLKLLLSTFPLLLLRRGLGASAACDEATSATIYNLTEALESDPSVQQQVRHKSQYVFITTILKQEPDFVN